MNHLIQCLAHHSAQHMTVLTATDKTEFSLVVVAIYTPTSKDREFQMLYILASMFIDGMMEK